ncbi:MAG TPA: hypothetical protein VKE74_01895, partial [Gemmataceae bacterium]|nr:hypothetical protein [Gemmataceae bacterium]
MNILRRAGALTTTLPGARFSPELGAASGNPAPESGGTAIGVVAADVVRPVDAGPRTAFPEPLGEAGRPGGRAVPTDPDFGFRWFWTELPLPRNAPRPGP